MKEALDIIRLFLLSKRQMVRISPHFLLSYGVPRADDRHVISGIIYVIRNGCNEKNPLHYIAPIQTPAL